MTGREHSQRNTLADLIEQRALIEQRIRDLLEEDLRAAAELAVNHGLEVPKRESSIKNDAPSQPM